MKSIIHRSIPCGPLITTWATTRSLCRRFLTRTRSLLEGLRVRTRCIKVHRKLGSSRPNSTICQASRRTSLSTSAQIPTLSTRAPRGSTHQLCPRSHSSRPFRLIRARERCPIRPAIPMTSSADRCCTLLDHRPSTRHQAKRSDISTPMSSKWSR